MANIDIDKVFAKKAKLESVRAYLKTQFFGIDNVIDQITSSIQTWYIMPELMTRPVVVACFGLTGSGKTALIRMLASELGFSHKFVEIQMDGFSEGGNNDEKSISTILGQSSIEEGSPGIVLLDEFQRFRTIDDMGQDIKVERYADVWMLLSDGRFPANYDALNRMERRMMFWDYWDDYHAAEKAEEDTKESDVKTEKPKRPSTYKRKYFTELEEARVLKEVLRLRLSLYEIMEWPKEKTREILRAAIDKKDIPPLDYTKCLVFVSGNLDDAFDMSKKIEDCDTDADIYHEHSKKIHSGDIKAALASRFKPEQIARLGNNYVIYPSLSRYAYMQIIRRSCQEYTDKATDTYGIRFDIDESVYQEIYDNAVYPAQGTRPVFTSIHKLFGSPLADAVLWAHTQGAQSLKVTLDVSESCLVFSHDGKSCAIKVDLEIRRRRAAHSDDFNSLVAVHEAGHALVYAELFKSPPLEVAISIASFKGGYNLFKTEHLSKQELLNRIAVGMGGIVAEELIFGQELRSTGCVNDVEKATQFAAEYVRRYAMDGFSSYITEEMPGHIMYNTDIELANPVIDQLVKDQKGVAQTILTKYRELLVLLAKKLIDVKKIKAAEFVTFAKDRIEGLESLADKDVNGDYAARLERA